MDPRKRLNPNRPPPGIQNGEAAGLWNMLPAGIGNIAQGYIDRVLPPPPPPPPPPVIQIYIKNVEVKVERGKEKDRGHVHHENYAKEHGGGTGTRKSTTSGGQGSHYLTQQSQTHAKHSSMTSSKQSGTGNTSMRSSTTSSKQSGMSNTSQSRTTTGSERGQSSSTTKIEKVKDKYKDNMKSKKLNGGAERTFFFFVFFRKLC
ncbi:uncharacterized protein LOC132271559 isoform X2 [Cornus florida]|uniref:uncharacterized protein LOC132271559 isoform X2 n=1 Tax=Cornus florida TaxID=4283 RepID=UPI00289E1204|nr:uncharacterized protein LOC132271559 isoform X2 [Cornus florida]